MKPLASTLAALLLCLAPTCARRSELPHEQTTPGVALGSRQFPPIALGSEMEWLLPHRGQSIYFLVERPSGSSDGDEWFGGHQRLFGPYDLGELPAELMMD